MLGNSRGLDAKGFCLSDVLPPSASHIFQRVNKNLKAGEIDIKDLDLHKWMNWWVCEGWSPMTFRFRRDKSNMPHSKPKPDDVLIHLSIDKFEPDLMQINADDNEEYHITRMVPPISIQYYFSFEGVPKFRVDIDSKSALVTNFPDLK